MEIVSCWFANVRLFLLAVLIFPNAEETPTDGGVAGRHVMDVKFVRRFAGVHARSNPSTNSARESVQHYSHVETRMFASHIALYIRC